MALTSQYLSPDPDEEADIWGVPSPDQLTAIRRSPQVDQETAYMESFGYDDHQDRIDRNADSE